MELILSSGKIDFEMLPQKPGVVFWHTINLSSTQYNSKTHNKVQTHIKNLTLI